MTNETTIFNHIRKIKKDFSGKNKSKIIQANNLIPEIKNKLDEFKISTIEVNKEIYTLKILNEAVDKIENTYPKTNILDTSIKDDYVGLIEKRLEYIKKYCDFYDRELNQFACFLQEIIEALAEFEINIEKVAGSKDKAKPHFEIVDEGLKSFIESREEIIREHNLYLMSIQNFAKHIKKTQFDLDDISYLKENPEKNSLYHWTEVWFKNINSFRPNNPNDYPEASDIFDCALDANDEVSAMQQEIASQIQTPGL